MEEDFDPQAILEEINELTKDTEEKQHELESIRKQIEAVNTTLLELRRKRDDIQAGYEENRRKINARRRDAEKAERLQEAKRKRELLLEEYNKKAAEIDLITIGAPWREFAYDHQIDGGKRLAIAKRGILADKRGLGKTLTSLVWLDMVKAKRILVLTPNKTVPQFVEEIQHWQPHRTIFNLANMDKAGRELMYPMLNIVDEFIVTLNYEAWRRDKSVIDDLVSAGIDTLICDEAHKIKSSTKITARGVFQIAYRPNYCPTCDKVQNYLGPWERKKGVVVDEFVNSYTSCETCGSLLETTVENTLMMTGTPIINKPQELFSMLYITDKDRFPSERKFLYDYCISTAPNRWVFVPGGLDRLTKYMSEFFVQRDRNSIGVHVPPPTINVYTIEKDYKNYHKQYTAEANLREAAIMIIEKDEEKFAKNFFNLLEIINRERQLMTWPAGIQLRDPETKEIVATCDVEESQKLDEAVDLINDLLEEGERVVVFSKFKAPLYEGHRRVSGQYKSVMATGDQSDRIRDQIRRDFDLKFADPDNYNYQIMWATYDAFGDSVNLNAARHMVIIDDEWAPGYEDQAIGRIDRLNNTDGATIHIFRVKDSIDDFMAKLLEEKRKLVGGFETNITARDLLNHLKDSI